jgi:hypothetical protein
LYLHFSYPPIYIDKQSRKVFDDCISITSILPLLDGEKKFFQLCKKMMGQPTARQSQIEAQISQSKQYNEDSTKEQQQQ